MSKLRSSVFGLALFGCGSDPGYGPRSIPPVAISENLPRPASSPEVPRATVRAMQRCADQYVPGLPGESFAVMYDVEVGGTGNVVKVKDSMLDGSVLERCLAGALEQMDAPVTNFRQNVSVQSRSMVGIVQAAAAPVAMLPVVLAAAGVTILVGVTIYVASETADAANELLRCREVKEKCIAHCSGLAGLPAPGGGRFRRCMRECMEAAGCSY